MYRDGVSDSQLETFVDVEMRDIQAAARQISGAIKVTVVVVKKRIFTRMYASMGADMDSPLPGTVFDFDTNSFFFVSQKPRVGTVLPTNYVVYLNEANFPIRDIQQYSYLQLHLYQNWTGSISSPAVCQLAHKLAFLFGQNILKAMPRDQNAEAFAASNKLYFL